MSEHSPHETHVTPLRSPEAQARVRAEARAFENRLDNTQHLGRQAIVRSLDTARERKQQRDAHERLAEIDELKQEYRVMVQRAVDEGWPIPDPAMRMRRLDAVEVQYGDISTGDALEEDRSALYYDGSDSRIVLSENRSSYNLRETLSHEWTHVLSNDNETTHSRFELFESIFGPKGSTVVNEALTEHLSQSLIYGDFEEMHVDRRSHQEDNPMYADERIFVAMLLHGGDRKISLKSVYETLYFSQQDSIVEFTHDDQVQQLLLKIDSAFPGLNVVARLKKFETDDEYNELYDDVEDYVARRTAEREQQEKDMRQSDGQLLDELFGSVEDDE